MDMDGQGHIVGGNRVEPMHVTRAVCYRNISSRTQLVMNKALKKDRLVLLYF
ncbi:hypothetical protein BDF20DRAFT_511225 [Mycotypha africana]|uniref:uncharacterized protein n=1 Tax=Mycotypha africana TaxID=64632 RepID=UPI0023004B3B|nr:uncharacterized protein BDF20DRAFT_511225 [Mycotypha africana]KAI8979504.1 hypothetical protein BDF20DRAFT_511225 [Mycotypha africana]